MIDKRISSYSRNEIVVKIADAIKKIGREAILERTATTRLEREYKKMTIQTALRELNNAVLDLQSSDQNTYDRPLKYLAATLASDDLKAIADELKAEVDFEEFVDEALAGARRLGSAKLNWPTNKNEVLGLSIVLIELGAEDPEWFENFAFNFYYSGNKISESIRKMVKSVIIPFNRDFTIHVMENLPNTNHE